MYFTAVTLLSSNALDMTNIVRFRYRLEGIVFNLCWVAARSEATSTVLFELQYADDVASLALLSTGLQRNIASLDEAYS